MKYILSVIFSFLCFAMVTAENKTKDLREDIEYQLDLLQTFTQTMYDDSLSFDPDSLSKVIANNIMEYIDEVGFDNFNANTPSYLEIYTDAPESPFSVISFGYDSGGTARIIPRSIIVKKEKEGYRYYNMAEFEAQFYEFYQLKDNIYLCFATVPGWSSCHSEEVSVFEFGNEAKPILVFNNYDYFSICNNYFSFDNKLMLLMIDTDMEQAYFSSNKDAIEIFKEVDSTDSDADTEHILISKFDGEKFVKP